MSKNLTLRIRDDLHGRLQAAADEDGRSLSSFVARLLDDALLPVDSIPAPLPDEPTRVRYGSRSSMTLKASSSPDPPTSGIPTGPTGPIKANVSEVLRETSARPQVKTFFKDDPKPKGRRR